MDFNETWKVIDNYFETHTNYLTKHHLDSYNDFILNKIPQTINQYNPQILYKELDKESGKFKYEIHIYYGGKDGSKIYFGKPIVYKEVDGETQQKILYPNEARLRNLSYSFYLFCDLEIEYIIRNGDEEMKVTKNLTKINLGQIPIMLHSKMCMLSDSSFDLRKNMGECPYDQGGYFVIDGQEKVIVSHERKAENKLYIVKSMDDLYSYSAQIKSVPDSSFKFARTTVVNINKKTNVITVRLPSVKKPIPLFILFRALGIEKDLDILKYILNDLESDQAQLYLEVLRPSIENVGPIYNQELALKYLTSLTVGNSISHLKDILMTDVFPHVGDNYIDKIYYLGYTVHKLLNVLHGIDPETDRDSFEYKRVDLSGFLLANLFRENFKQYQRDTKIAVDSEYRFNSSQYQDENYQNIINSDNIKKIFNENVITNAFGKAFKIGTILNKKGLIQSLNRLSYVGTTSHLRRINTYGDNIMIGQRKLHPTQYGIICPVETPDGGNIGIKKHLTVTGHITFGCESASIINLLYRLGVKSLDNIVPLNVNNNCKVLVNGKWIGIHYQPGKLTTLLRLLRRNSFINIFTSIIFDNRNLTISILTDGGRCCRPLYIMKDNKLTIQQKHVDGLKSGKISWYNLVGGFSGKKTSYYDCNVECPKSINEGNIDAAITELEKTSAVIEFLDTDEMTGVNLCTNINRMNETMMYSHCEIHPSLIMGILGFTIPYVNTSQAPRNVYGTGQTKQSVGIYTSNFNYRFDTSAHLLHYPQKPLVSTRLAKYAFIDKLPTGINAIVAIASYSGYNQDDSIIINRSSVERGLFVSSYFKTYDGKEVSDARDSTEEIFYNPNNEDNMDVKKKSEYNYTRVNKNGLVTEGMYVKDNDVLISKYVKGGGIKKDDSVAVKMDGYGVVDKVFSDYYNSNKQKMARVRICTYRNPMLGDKFASRHGQKGVIGMIIPQEDMPFTKDGIVPDIIINPHAIPSRMTIGQLIECVMGKACSIGGFYADATPFTNIDNNEIFNILEKNCNFQRHSDEILYSGINGKQMSTKIFIGPTYYQRLKHMVKDKINSRERGPVSLKTRQPPSGRSAGGGLRIGEMERDAILSHGAAQFLKETMVERSDKYTTYLSSHSGMTSIVNGIDNKFICPTVSGPLEFDEENRIVNDNSECDIGKVIIPYNTNLLMQECNAMGISMRLILDKESEYKELTQLPKTKAFELQDGDKRKGLKKVKGKKKRISRNKFNDKRFDEIENNKVKVTNLSSATKVADLYKLFDNVYKIVMDFGAGTAIITFTNDTAAASAIEGMNHSLLDNNRIVLSLHTKTKDLDYFPSGIDYGKILNPEGGAPAPTEPTSPSYIPASYSPRSPTYKPGSYEPTSGQYDLGSYKPNSPTYVPTSPDYKPGSPAYHEIGSYEPVSPGGEPPNDLDLAKPSKVGYPSPKEAPKDFIGDFVPPQTEDVITSLSPMYVPSSVSLLPENNLENDLDEEISNEKDSAFRVEEDTGLPSNDDIKNITLTIDPIEDEGQSGGGGENTFELFGGANDLNLDDLTEINL